MLTESTMLHLGTKAKNFALPDVTGKMFHLSDFDEADVLVLAFICCHCPFVVHLKPALAAFDQEFRPRNVAFVAINSNDASSHPDDAPAFMECDIEQYGYRFPFLIDQTQKVAKAYTAACTPDFFVFDRARSLVYRGQFDGSRPGNRLAITGDDLRNAVEAVLAGKEVAPNQKPSIGCNIKWRAGNAPDYY